MLTPLQIKNEIDVKVRSILVNTPFSNVRVLAWEQETIRPAIKVLFEKSSIGTFSSTCRDLSLSFSIHFFAADPNQYTVDNMNMQDMITNALLEGLYVNGSYIPISSVTSLWENTILICNFEVNTVELLPEIETSEILEEIKIREVIK